MVLRVVKLRRISFQTCSRSFTAGGSLSLDLEIFSEQSNHQIISQFAEKSLAFTELQLRRRGLWVCGLRGEPQQDPAERENTTRLPVDVELLGAHVKIPSEIKVQSGNIFQFT